MIKHIFGKVKFVCILFLVLLLIQIKYYFQIIIIDILKKHVQYALLIPNFLLSQLSIA